VRVRTFIISVFLCAAGVPAARAQDRTVWDENPREPASVLPPRVYGFVVGVEKGQGTRPMLKKAVQGAREFAQQLVQSYGLRKDFHLKLLTNKAATSGKVRASIQRGLRRLPENSLVFIYFAGHGERRLSPSQRPGPLVLVTNDTPRKSNGEDYFNRSVRVSDVYNWINLQPKPLTVFLILDCCHGKVAGRARGGLGGLAKAGPRILTFSASGVLQEAYQGHFTSSLLTAWRRANDTTHLAGFAVEVKRLYLASFAGEPKGLAVAPFIEVKHGYESYLLNGSRRYFLLALELERRWVAPEENCVMKYRRGARNVRSDWVPTAENSTFLRVVDREAESVGLRYRQRVFEIRDLEQKLGESSWMYLKVGPSSFVEPKADGWSPSKPTKPVLQISKGSISPSGAAGVAPVSSRIAPRIRAFGADPTAVLVARVAAGPEEEERSRLLARIYSVAQEFKGTKGSDTAAQAAAAAIRGVPFQEAPHPQAALALLPNLGPVAARPAVQYALGLASKGGRLAYFAQARTLSTVLGQFPRAASRQELRSLLAMCFDIGRNPGDLAQLAPILVSFQTAYGVAFYGESLELAALSHLTASSHFERGEYKKARALSRLVELPPESPKPVYKLIVRRVKFGGFTSMRFPTRILVLKPDGQAMKRYESNLRSYRESGRSALRDRTEGFKRQLAWQARRHGPGW
jgi:caspase domain-containing protein